jgi:hypothetical protein
MDAILDLCRLSHEKRATMEELPATASVSIGDPYRREEIHPQELGKLSRIDGVGLRASLPDQLNLSGICNPSSVSQRFELIVKPLPVECGFHCNRDRVSEWSEKIAQRVD